MANGDNKPALAIARNRKSRVQGSLFPQGDGRASSRLPHHPVSRRVAGPSCSVETGPGADAPAGNEVAIRDTDRPL